MKQLVAAGISGTRVGFARLAAAFLLVTAVYGGVGALAAPALTGDEPHYLLEAFSLIEDGDRDLADDYVDRATKTKAYGDPSLDSHAYQYVAGEAVRRSVHGPGMPVLLLGSTMCEDPRLCSRLAMVPWGAASAALLLVLLMRLLCYQGWVTWAAWAGTVFSFPLIAFGTQVYPEVPATTLVLLGAVLLSSPELRSRHIAGATLVAAALPWLHVRYVVLTTALLGVLLVRLLLDAVGGVAALRRIRTVGALRVRAWLFRWGASVGGSALSLAALLLAFRRWYGSASLSAPYDAIDFKQSVSPSMANVPRNLLGQLIDERQGWLSHSPLALVALIGLLVLWRRMPFWTSVVCACALGYASSVAATGVSPGFALPGRYLVVLMPWVAFPLAAGLVNSWTVRVAATAAVPPTLALVREFTVDVYAMYPGTYLGTEASARIRSVFPSLDVTVGATAPPEYVAAVVVLGTVALLALAVLERELGGRSHVAPQPTTSPLFRRGAAGKASVQGSSSQGAVPPSGASHSADQPGMKNIGSGSSEAYSKQGP